MAGHAMIKVRPAAAEVKNMLLKIKMDNVKRGKAIAARNSDSSHDGACSVNYPVPFSFHGGCSCGGAQYIGSPSKPKAFESFMTKVDDNNTVHTSTNYTMMPMHRSLHAFSSLGTASALAVNDFAENHNSEKQPIKEAFEEMGSFTSMAKIIPATDTDKDIEHEFRQLQNKRHLTGRKDSMALDDFLDHCSKRLTGLPEPISRNWKNLSAETISSIKNRDSTLSGVNCKEENIRVFQWNVLSQTLGTKNDNFVRCPKSALDWKTRRFRMLEEIARHDADVICLQEVDHFPLVKEALSSLNYDGHFFPKPDSPCLYLPENSGPDGCAIFYKRNKFDLQKVDSRVIEVWCVQSNQVVLSTVLKSKLTQSDIVIATTHLKARNGALLSTLRNEQGKDLLSYLERVSCNGKLPVICTGDFNAEPTEPVYQTISEGTDKISFQSAYAESKITDGGVKEHQKEPSYTTWKIREDGEHIQTLDYIFYHTPDSFINERFITSEENEDSISYSELQDTPQFSSQPLHSNIKVEKVLEFPTGEQISADRVPSFAYASDHFSLIADFKIKSSVSELEE